MVGSLDVSYCRWTVQSCDVAVPTAVALAAAAMVTLRLAELASALVKAAVPRNMLMPHWLFGGDNVALYTLPLPA